MVERIDDPHPGYLTFEHGRVPDGHIVPNPHRPEPPPEPLPPSYYPPHRGGVVTAIAICTLIVVALMVAGIAGAWR